MMPMAVYKIGPSLKRSPPLISFSMLLPPSQLSLLKGRWLTSTVAIYFLLMNLILSNWFFFLQILPAVILQLEIYIYIPFLVVFNRAFNHF